MTIPVDSDTRTSQIGNGVTTEFTATFKIYDEKHITIYVDGSKQTISTDYTVSGVGDPETTITFLTAPTSGAEIVMVLTVPIEQSSDFVDGERFSAETVERALDLRTQVDLQQEDENARSLRLNPSDLTDTSVASLILPSKAEREGKFLSFDSNGGIAMSSTNSDTVTPLDSADNEVVLFSGTSGKILKRPGTEYLVLPQGTSAERGSPSSVSLRGNTSNNTLEAYLNGSWTDIRTGQESFDTVAAVQAASINESINIIDILGHTTSTDGGGARYVRVASEPAHDGKIQDAASNWWEIREPSLNFLMFGADSSGTADASPEMQTCLDVAAAIDVEVFNKTGIFRIDTPLEVPANITIRATEDVTYKSNVATSEPMFLNGTYGGTYTAQSANGNIKMIGGNMDANGQNVNCIAFAQAKDILIQDIIFYDLVDVHFIEVNAITNARIEGCTFRDMNETGSRSYTEAINVDFFGAVNQFPHFNAASADGTVCENIQIINNYFENCLVSIGAHGYTAYGDGTEATMSKDILIKGNTHVNNGVNAIGPSSDVIHIDGFFNTIIEGETGRNGAVNFIKIDESINCSISNCSIDDFTSGNMVFLAGSASIPIQNTSISGCSARNILDVVNVFRANRLSITGCTGETIRNGVQATLSDDVTISGNTFNDCSRSGIYVYTGCDRFSITGNTIRDTAEAIVDLDIALFTLCGNTLSVPGASKDVIRLDSCTNGMIANNIANGGSVAAVIYVTGSTTDTSLLGNMFAGAATNSILIDSGCDDILYDQNRFLGSSTLTDNGSNSVVGTNWTT
jgi:parallel beta-helix repeat protein